MNSHQVLIVEDNSALSDLLRDVLTAFGFSVLVAGNGAEALTMLATYEVDAAIADVELPCMSGFEFCRAARKQEATLGRSLPIWLMTGSHEPDIERQAESAGAMTLLYKPFSIAELGARLRDEVLARSTSQTTGVRAGHLVARVGIGDRKAAKSALVAK